MSIFIVFLGIVSQSYVGIIRSQRQANGVRKIYSELRVFFETLAQDARLGSPAYDCYELQPQNNNNPDPSANLEACPSDVKSDITGQFKQNYLALIDKENTELTVYRFNLALHTAQVRKYKHDSGGSWQAEDAYPQGGDGSEGVDQDGYRNLLSNDVKIKNLGFVLNPAVNPYAALNVDKSGDQFQPLVNVFLTAENVGKGLTPFKLDLQTSFSSRVYSRK
ncbi:MAG: hypothetical protein WC843_03725 [Candidatus Gracilibacteria bacterium]